MIGLRNLISWPVTHGRRHGWLALVDSFLKLLCLMFESGEYELGLELIDKASSRPEARLEALHKLNLNHGLAATTKLMRIVVCGLAAFEEASAAFLVTFRAPWKLSARITREMDRAEYVRYITERHVPVRLSFVPMCAFLPRSELRGSGFVVDLNTGMGWNGGLDAVKCMDDVRFQVSTACMYEHMHLYDPEGHVAVGGLLCVASILASLVQFQIDASTSFFDTFASFVRLELEMRFFVDVNTGEYRDLVDARLARACDRSCQTLMMLLGTESIDALTPALGGMPVHIHTAISSATLHGLIRDSVSAKAANGLHMAIAHGARDPHETRPLPHGMKAGMDHHFLAVWFTQNVGAQSVD